MMGWVWNKMRAIFGEREEQRKLMHEQARQSAQVLSRFDDVAERLSIELQNTERALRQEKRRDSV